MAKKTRRRPSKAKTIKRKSLRAGAKPKAAKKKTRTHFKTRSPSPLPSPLRGEGRVSVQRPRRPAKKQPPPIAEVITKATEFESGEYIPEESKYNIGVEHNAQALVTQDIPAEYKKDMVTLLVVDPRFVFAYWEVKPDTMLEVANQAGEYAKLTLRFYDITSTHDPETSSFWDVEAFDRLGNWYLRLEHPSQRLCLDVGMKGTTGSFIRIARSNIMRLPQQTLARPGPIKWMVVTPQGNMLMSDVEEYTDADMELLKKILGPHFFDLLMRGRFASIAGSSLEAVFYDVHALKGGASPTTKPPWINP